MRLAASVGGDRVLSTLLSQLQGYFSKYFVVGSFSPMLAFAFINGAAAYLVFDSWRSWADANILNASVTGGAFLTTSIVVAVVLTAYVLSSLSTFLRQQLEGKWWDFVASRFVPAQNKRRLALLDALNNAFQEMADLDHIGEWKAKLRDARKTGTLAHPKKKFSAAANDKIETKLGELEDRRKKHAIVAVADLTEVATLLEQRLQEYDVNVSVTLEKEQGRLSALIVYASGFFSEEGARGRHTQLQNELNSNFSGGQIVAPTKMGNIAETIQSYAMRRYRCNLEVLWTNLMQIVQKDAKAQATLMEAKTQLDFLVACCWLTLLTGVIWSVIAFAVVPSRWGFLLAALGGPFGGYLWYRAAAEQYRSFADVAMTLFDTFRFDLLGAMRLQAPADVDQERILWSAVDKLMTFGEQGNFRYEKAQQTPAPAQPATPAAS
jgi:hypothetical protein